MTRSKRCSTPLTHGWTGPGRKGALTAMRDAAVLKTVYAYGLRRNKTRMLDLADLRRATKRPQYRQYGGLYARYGKASEGSPPKRRTILTVPEMDWIVDVLDHWVTEVRPLFSPGRLPAAAHAGPFCRAAGQR
jgi:integrase